MSTNNKCYKTLRLILGDQLNAKHSWYQKREESTLYIIAELHQETNYVKHHGQKICAFFKAMSLFAKALSDSGHQVLYLSLDDTQHYDTLPSLLTQLCEKYSIQYFHYQRPDEYRLLNQLQSLKLFSSKEEDIPTIEYDTEHFLLPYDEINHYFSKNKKQKMEFFYRKIRQRFNILIEEGKPLGGKWNFDSENRQSLKKKDINDIPQPLLFSNNVSSILQRLKKHNVDFFGECDEEIVWPTTRQQSKQLLDYFCQYCLPNFGRFQDAMTENGDNQWSLYHSRLSFSINTKMLHPLQVITVAIEHYEKEGSDISLAQIEGFVRQIIGWREFIRGIYWINMPEYAEKNHFQHHRDLPEYFWSANTKMNCVKHAVNQSLTFSYAHHIQRLMITGNFCLLTGIDPQQVDNWYLGIYIDAIEWVEMPNTRGMSQFADGGIVATKPYISGGNYINKMSDYCRSCHYDVKEKETDNACPFNSLYWNFMIKHKEELEKNPRIGMIYRNWEKQDLSKKQQVIQRAEWCIDHIEDL